MPEDRISFSTDYMPNDMDRHLLRLAQGQLTGVPGLVHDVVSALCIPKQERGPLRYLKAGMDCVAAVVTYREGKKRVVDGGCNPSLLYLREEGYREAFPEWAPGFSTFVRSALAQLEFREKRCRGALGELDTMVLREFELGAGGGVGYFVDPFGQKESKSSQWFGPYVQPKDLQGLLDLVHRTVWSRLGTDTIMLEPAPGVEHAGGEAVSLAPVSGEFDFCDGLDGFNDAKAMAARCGAFLRTSHRTIAFYGPPGTGKTTLSRAIAKNLGLRTVILSSDAISSLAEATTSAILAQVLRPGAIVMNDVDRAGGREHLALLQGLEMVPHNVLVCITVNDLEMLDPALLRPGRCELKEVPEPSDESRERILDHYLAKHSVTLTPSERARFLERTVGWSPADVREFVLTAVAVGTSMALEEVDTRLSVQRAIYSGDRVQQFNRARAPRHRWRHGRHAHLPF